MSDLQDLYFDVEGNRDYAQAVYHRLRQLGYAPSLEAEHPLGPEYPPATVIATHDNGNITVYRTSAEVTVRRLEQRGHEFHLLDELFWLDEDERAERAPAAVVDHLASAPPPERIYLRPDTVMESAYLQRVLHELGCTPASRRNARALMGRKHVISVGPGGAIHLHLRWALVPRFLGYRESSVAELIAMSVTGKTESEVFA